MVVGAAPVDEERYLKDTVLGADDCLWDVLYSLRAWLLHTSWAHALYLILMHACVSQLVIRSEKAWTL